MRRAKTYSRFCSQTVSHSVYLQPFHRSSFSECVMQQKVAKKSIKTSYFGSSGSFKVVDVDTIEKLVTSA